MRADDLDGELGAAANFAIVIHLGGADQGVHAAQRTDQTQAPGGGVANVRACVIGQHASQRIDRAVGFHLAKFDGRIPAHIFVGLAELLQIDIGRGLVIT